MAEAFDWSEESVLAEARAATGLDDFGDDAFRGGLRALLRTYAENAFSEKGRKRNRRRVVTLLATRLQVEDALRRHPEVLERPVREPCRADGAAALGDLGALQSARRGSRRPAAAALGDAVPGSAGGLAPGAPDPRREAIDAYYAKGRAKNPDWTKIHFTSADTPEECVLLHAYACHGVQLGIEPMLEPYASWYQAQVADLRPLYEYQRKLMQLLDWQRPGERWLLKAPAHLWGLDALAATFPDVAIVWTHRDPVACIASACSMTAR